MVENRKLFYAISVLLLSCCQIITMFPHNADSELLLLSPPSPSQSDAGKTRTNTRSNTADTSSSNNSEYNRANVDSGSSSSSHQSYGNNDDDSEFIIAVERKLHDQLQHQHQHQHHHQTMRQPIDGALSQPGGNLGVWEGPDIEVSENVDDLIFLDKRLPINQHQYVAQLPPRLPPPPSSAMEQLHRHHQHLFEIHHHLSADGLDSGSSSTSDEHSDSLTHPTFASSTVASKNVEDVHFHAHHLSDGEAAETETDADGVWPQPHEIQLQPDNNEEVSGATISTSADAVAPPLDLSDFLALIPAAKVKAIVAHYYRNDPEVQRANAFLSSRDFISLKHHIISIPEMSAFLRYLNSSGLDLVHFVTTLTNLTTTVVVPATTTSTATTSPTEKGQMTINAGSTAFETNDIEYGQKQSTTTAAAEIWNIEIPTHPTSSESTAFTPSMPSPMPTLATESVTESAMASATTDMETTTVKEQLNGLHGLVDSILDVLPQDQILATFFDKLESSEQFSKLVDNIGSPEFSKILNNMQNSVPLRNLIFTLHNNGIYVIRIVDSLKSYFFLGGF